MKNYQVMIFNAVVLTGLGIYGYIISNSKTALIPVGIGILLFALSFPVKKENSLMSHIAVGLTGISVIMFFITGILRDNNIIIIMAVVSLVALLFYISDFFRRKKERETQSP